MMQQLIDLMHILENMFMKKQSMVVLYVDLVGSTGITLTLPEEKIAIIISSFAQENGVCD